MWHINKLRFLYANTTHKLSSLPILRLSTKSTRLDAAQAETTAINPLFKEITEILGCDEVIYQKNPSKENHVLTEDLNTHTQGACENVELSNSLQGGKTEIRVSKEIDVSSIVNEVTRIVRAEVSMEERLDSLGFQLDTHIVDKVLKRCFKVPQLACKFFNWVKIKDGFFHNTDTYNTMLYIVGEAKEFNLADCLVEEMEKYSCEKDIKTWNILISKFGKAKMIGKALFFFEKMKKSGCEPDEKIYKTMVHSLCNAGKGEVAMELYKEMVRRDLRLDLSLYKVLLNTMAKLGDVGAVNTVTDDMIRLSMIPERNVLVCMLKSFCVAGRIREALELIREFKSKEIALDYECFETLLKGLCRAGRIADALEITEIMKRRSLVDSKVYGIIINGYLKRNELSKAMELFQIMKESGHQPALSTYTELMQNLFDSYQYQKGFQLYNEMLERGIKADSVVIMAVVAAHVRQNHILEAWEAFNSMEYKGIKPTWKSYSIFIKELCKLSRTDELLKVLHKMQASMISIDSKIFKWVIACMEKNGEMENVKKVKQMQRFCSLHPGSGQQELQVELEQNHDRLEEERIEHKGYNEQDCREICRILSSSEDWSIIQGTLGKCGVQFTPELILEVLRNCSIHGKAALQFFSWVGTQSGYNHTTETYNIAMKISGRGKDFKHMRSLYYEMRRKGCLITHDTWGIMIMQYGRTGLTEIALKIFNEMKDGGYIPTESTYKYLIISLCGRKGRKVDEAIKIFHEMIGAGYIPDREMVETYLCCLCEVGKLSEARKSEDCLGKIGFTVPLSRSLHIRALCRAGRLEEAKLLLKEAGTERSTLDECTSASFVHALLRKGQEEEALAKVEAMKKAGIRLTVHIYTSFIVHFLKEKRMEKAMEVLEEMQQEGCEGTIVTYSALIRGYMDMGRDVDAWNVFNHLKLKGPAPDFKTYSMFITGLCKVGKSEESLKLIYEMLDNGIVPSSINFRTVFYGLNREGKHDLARTVLQQKLSLKK
ncbi:putative pentatricopeptide repeat-containing protein At5g06400, mitochondrial [Euphorbia lathyris]|uniref:putative pentatricopeptide repeat-containing protein At5g06400, mitochondrial n=1 Tax=Euphorbia lathyris TaxID=212925 RepID=UPI0033143C23